MTDDEATIVGATGEEARAALHAANPCLSGSWSRCHQGLLGGRFGATEVVCQRGRARNVREASYMTWELESDGVKGHDQAVIIVGSSQMPQ